MDEIDEQISETKSRLAALKNREDEE